MKKLVVLGMGLCVALAFSSCKSSESAYKKAYEKAKQQELAEAPAAAEEVEAAPVVAAPVATAPAPAPVAGPVREEKVELVSGDGLKAYSVVCGSFGVKANAEGLKQYLDGQGYSAKVVYNPERNMYRVLQFLLMTAHKLHKLKKNLKRNILTVTTSRRHGYFIEYINNFFLVN